MLLFCHCIRGPFHRYELLLSSTLPYWPSCFIVSVCDLLPLLGSNSVDLPAKQLFRLLHKSIEFYLCYLMSPSKAILVCSSCMNSIQADVRMVH